MRGFHQELAHHALHTRPGTLLWCDGDHGFNPYDFAELNLTRGFDADWGDERLLVKRCMTPFQWATVLTRHVGQILRSIEASLVLAAPYDALFSTEELKDWEQEDYVRDSLNHLKGLAGQHGIPILISVDMTRWWRTHPFLARLAQEAADARWILQPSGDGWRAVQDHHQLVIDPLARRQTTLWDYAERSPAPRLPLSTNPPTHRREGTAPL